MNRLHCERAEDNMLCEGKYTRAQGDEGFSVVMTTAQHKATRTYAGNNKTILRLEKGLDLNVSLQRDLEDAAKILKDPTLISRAHAWYKAHPEIEWYKPIS